MIVFMKTRTRNLRRCRMETYIDFPNLPRRFDWQVANISPDGCQVSGNLDLNLDEKVECVLTVPEYAMDIQLSARVVWKYRNSYGLEFQDFPAGMKFRLALAIYRTRKAA